MQKCCGALAPQPKNSFGDALVPCPPQIASVKPPLSSSAWYHKYHGARNHYRPGAVFSDLPCNCADSSRGPPAAPLPSPPSRRHPGLGGQARARRLRKIREVQQEVLLSLHKNNTVVVWPENNKTVVIPLGPWPEDDYFDRMDRFFAPKWAFGGVSAVLSS